MYRNNSASASASSPSISSFPNIQQPQTSRSFNPQQLQHQQQYYHHQPHPQQYKQQPHPYGLYGANINPYAPPPQTPYQTGPTSSIPTTSQYTYGGGEGGEVVVVDESLPPIFRAIQLKRVDELKEQLENVNTSEEDVKSAFLTCVKYGEIRMVKLLLDHDRSSSIVNINGEENGPNPLKLAYDNGKMLMFHFLANCGADLDAANLLNVSAAKGYIALCSYMLMRGASVRSSVDPQGRSALHVAMEGKNRTISLEILYKCIEREVPNGATQEEKRKCIDRWLFQEKDSVGKSPASLVPTGSEKWLEEVRYAAQFGPETIQYYRENFPSRFYLSALIPPLFHLSLFLGYFFMGLVGFVGIFVPSVLLLFRARNEFVTQHGPFLFSMVVSATVTIDASMWFLISPVIYDRFYYYIWVVACVNTVFFYYQVRTTLSSPGTIRSPRITNDNMADFIDDGMTDFEFCVICWIRKPWRSKHCQYCNRCVPKYDHHCPFSYNCIGWRNHWFYYHFILSTNVLAFCILCASWLALRELTDPQTNLYSFRTILSAAYYSDKGGIPILLIMAYTTLILWQMMVMFRDQCCTVVILGYTLNESAKARAYPYLKGGVNPFRFENPFYNYASLDASKGEFDFERPFTIPQSSFDRGAAVAQRLQGGEKMV